LRGRAHHRQRLGFELLTQARLEALAAEEFGAGTPSDKAWASLAIPSWRAWLPLTT